MQCQQSPEKGIRGPGTGVIDGCGLPCGHWGEKAGL